MTSRGDKIEQAVNPVVPKARVTLNPGLLGQDVIVLTLEVAHNLLETVERRARLVSVGW